MSGLGLHIGLNSLLGARSALDVIGHNLANATTPGYSRQDLGIAAGRPIHLGSLGFGTGIDTQVVQRTIDSLLQKRIVSQIGRVNTLEGKLGVLRQVESLLGEPGGSGVQERLNGFFASFAELSGSPADGVLRSGATQSGEALAARIRDLAAGLDDASSDALGQARAQVGRVNELAEQISRLNLDIARSESSGIPANDLRDQRELALKEMGAIVDVRAQEDAVGIMRVTVGGQLVVGSERAYALEAFTDDEEAIGVRLVGNDRPLALRSGLLAGYVGLSQGSVPDLRARLDQLAHELALGVNREHTTGVPASGPFRQLLGAHRFESTSTLLAESGLPFETQSGALYVNVIDDSDGSVRSQRIDIDAERTSVADFVAALNAVDHLAADITADGRLRVSAEGGYGFDFAARLDLAPDPAGMFGGAAPSLGAQDAGPYALSAGDTLTLNGLSGPFTITFQAASFAFIGRATPAEVAAAINADPNTAAGGLRAVVEGERVFLQGIAPGSAQSFGVIGGSALATFGWTAGTTVSGHDIGVSVELGGSYTGEDNDAFTFRPRSDGTVGTTPGLIVDVVDSHGLVVASLDVGDGYRPGRELTVADGVTVAFGFGELSATNNDAFTVDLVHDADTSDVLVATGLNVFFSGGTAADLAVREDLLRNPALLAASATGAAGDNGVLLALESLARQSVAALGGRTIGAFWGETTGNIGFEIANATSALEVESLLAESLETRREQISGVNVDEELVNMIQFEQAFQASSQFIQVVNSLNDELLSLV